MADLQSPFTDPAMAPPDPSGDSISSRGGDPNVMDSGASGLQPIWSDKTVPDPPVRETSNSVSGLPATPSRWTPTETPPSPPDLTDRNPGTIDER